MTKPKFKRKRVRKPLEKLVRALKKHPEIDNPWAMAAWLKKKGLAK